ncbi:tetratricopeptide repeat protein [Vibrio sp. TRT 21S02]|uniref:tetratricopeptide repeat protein n=1 Tax=Vibrio sp. TRT 21S02 TaxID=3418507 RepID=UPI003CF6D120
MIKQILLGVSLIATAGLTQAAELSQYTAVRVQKAHQQVQNDKIKQAISTLASIDTSRGYDKAYIARMLGVYYWQDGQVKKAIQQIQYAVDSGLLEDEQAWVTRKMLADLLLSDQKYQQALPHYYQLAKKVPEKQKADELWLRIAQSHYQIEQWAKVVSAVDKYRSYQRKDEVQPLSLKLGALLQLKRYKNAIPTLKKLIALQPEKANWWRQLVGLQMQTGQNAQALATLGLAKHQGVALSQQELRLMAQLYAQKGIPERAARQIEELDKSKTDLKLIVEQASYWQMAREWDKATDQWALAAKQDSKYHWNVAQLLVQQGHYRTALTVLNKVKGRNAEVALVKARALYKLNQIEDALAQAKKSQAIKPSTQAKSWVKYLSNLRKSDDKNQSS